VVGASNLWHQFNSTEAGSQKNWQVTAAITGIFQAIFKVVNH
jgi:hypothetical protein